MSVRTRVLARVPLSVVGLVWAVIAASLQAYAMAGRPAGVPVNPPRGNTVTLPRDAGDTRIAQTFVVNAAGLEEIALYPVTPTRAGAHVDLTLTDVTPGLAPSVVARARADASGLAAEQPFMFRFPAVAGSRGHTFDLTLDVRGGADAPAFLAVADSTYGEGALRVDGRPEWGDLAFVARATEDTPFGQLRAHTRAAGWPELPAVAWILLACLYNAGCAAALWSFMAPAWRLARAEPAGRS